MGGRVKGKIVSNLLSSPASGETMTVYQTNTSTSSFQFIEFPSEWGETKILDLTDRNLVEVSNLLSSPASGEFMMELPQGKLTP